MGKSNKQKKKSSTKSINRNASVPGGGDGQDWIDVDPQRVRFQHARVRPYFSGCGRSVEGTLESIREGKMKATDLPPIQVLIGPDDEDGKPWYFSLNNRRLWVLKRCREEGLLERNLIQVRVRKPKSSKEAQRYTIENCALEAKFLRERQEEKVTDKGECHEKKDGDVINNDSESDDATSSDEIVGDGVVPDVVGQSMESLRLEKEVIPAETEVEVTNLQLDESDKSVESEEDSHSSSPNRHTFHRNTFCFDDDETSSSDSD